MGKLNSTLVEGGPDSRYIPMMTAEGTLTFGDLTPYGKPVDFIGQTWHTTENLLYNDTINFLVYPYNKKDGYTKVSGVLHMLFTICVHYMCKFLMPSITPYTHSLSPSPPLSPTYPVFSQSQIGGAYGDDGQNFFNIKSLFDSITWENKYKLVHADKSCSAELAKEVDFS